MIECPSVPKKVVRQHYDLVTPFYWLLWGRTYITDCGSRRSRRHGPNSNSRKPWPVRRASEAERTFSTSAAAWAVRPSTWHGRSVAVLRESRSAVCNGSGRRTRRVGIARPATPSFIASTPSRRAFRPRRSTWCGASNAPSTCTTNPASSAVPPNGCGRADAWPSAPGWPAITWQHEQQVRQVHDVCEGFFCPSLGTRGDYRQWMTDAGLTVEQDHDWTARVERTWEICRRRVRRSRRPLAGRSDRSRYGHVSRSFRHHPRRLSQRCDAVWLFHRQKAGCRRPKRITRMYPWAGRLGIAFGLGTHALFGVTVWYLFWFLKDGPRRVTGCCRETVCWPFSSASSTA